MARLAKACKEYCCLGADTTNPRSYGESQIPPPRPDPGRAAVDELLQDGFNLLKPILAICYVQALNVWRNGSSPGLEQEGKTVGQSRPRPRGTRRASLRITWLETCSVASREGDLPVNSSHHLCPAAGDNHVPAICPVME